MAKITFLLGAGASFESLPIVSNLIAEIKKFKSEIFLLRPKFNDQFNKQNEFKRVDHAFTLLLNDIDWLVIESGNHLSVDTLAKKLLTINEKSKFKILKNVLTAFFIYRQLPENQLDQRYDSFIAALIDHKSHKLPDTIRIISWNYDFQIEKAFSRYINENNINEVQKILNVYPSRQNNNLSEVFSIYKLNGSTHYLFDDGKTLQHPVGQLNSNSRYDNLWEILSYYNDHQAMPGISFSWEEDRVPFIEKVKNAIEHTNILVVIGYSFPYFNRKIDRLLLKDLPLSKVYFQTIKSDVDEMIQGFLSIREMQEKSCIPRTQVNQFYLPPELNF